MGYFGVLTISGLKNNKAVLMNLGLNLVDFIGLILAATIVVNKVDWVYALNWLIAGFFLYIGLTSMLAN